MRTTWRRCYPAAAYHCTAPVQCGGRLAGDGAPLFPEAYPRHRCGPLWRSEDDWLEGELADVCWWCCCRWCWCWCCSARAATRASWSENTHTTRAATLWCMPFSLSSPMILIPNSTILSDFSLYGSLLSPSGLSSSPLMNVPLELLTYLTKI